MQIPLQRSDKKLSANNQNHLKKVHLCEKPSVSVVVFVIFLVLLSAVFDGHFVCLFFVHSFTQLFQIHTHWKKDARNACAQKCWKNKTKLCSFTRRVLHVTESAIVQLVVCFPCGHCSTCLLLWNKTRSRVIKPTDLRFECLKCTHKLVECQPEICSMSTTAAAAVMIMSNYGFCRLKLWQSQSHRSLHVRYFSIF